ncbi:Eukaryotic translation initiation factor 4E-like 3 [Cladobotryum mycophilum]|uniref:Eukaryotic translation initiation factor 4E-like 3 n=1 Tax=Cladobotryum mycophilum TaxID=491253 RepID=A0ABR0SNU3_9HYPO
MDNLWTRRTNTNKLSLSTTVNGTNGTSTGDPISRNASSKRLSGDTSSHGKANHLTATPGSGLVSPTGGASSAFGLGSGAFASFGSAKTPKSGGNPFDVAMGTAISKQGVVKDGIKLVAKPPSMAAISETKVVSGPATSPQVHVLKDAWSFWYRPPISKAHGFIEYENTLHGIATVRTAEEFWEIYSHLKRPSTLPVVSDYHLFKKDIRPIWEDEVNRKGGKWVVRMKKGVADRFWEDLLLSLIGDQFGDAGEDVCGAVLSMRNGEDILSIWTRTDGGRVIKIREIMKHLLNFPGNTRVEFKSHDSSIQQRTAIDEQRREKAHHHSSTTTDKRASTTPQSRGSKKNNNLATTAMCCILLSATLIVHYRAQRLVMSQTRIVLLFYCF